MWKRAKITEKMEHYSANSEFFVVVFEYSLVSEASMLLYDGVQIENKLLSLLTKMLVNLLLDNRD